MRQVFYMPDHAEPAQILVSCEGGTLWNVRIVYHGWDENERVFCIAYCDEFEYGFTDNDDEWFGDEDEVIQEALGIAGVEAPVILEGPIGNQ